LAWAFAFISFVQALVVDLLFKEIPKLKKSDSSNALKRNLKTKIRQDENDIKTEPLIKD